MKIALLFGSLFVLVALLTAQQPAPATAKRALLDQYCVTCHNDKLKTANFSLQKLDLTAVGDQPEVWEKVVRKLRAGLMPPPGMRRPPLAEYEGLRDWLETEIDHKAASHPNPGSVILHRLNRTEYANAVRDLLDLEIDTTTLLPQDDSARGFDNIAGALYFSGGTPACALISLWAATISRSNRLSALALPAVKTRISSAGLMSPR